MMKKISIFLYFILFLISNTSGQNKTEKLLLGGSGWNKIVIIDKESKQIEWEHPLQEGWECNSVAATPDGNILFSYGKGAKTINRNHQEIWNITVPDGCEMQTARVLSDGNYLLAWTGHPAVIMEVSPKGEILSETVYETGIDHPHAQFRQVNKNKAGNYLIDLLLANVCKQNVTRFPYEIARLAQDLAGGLMVTQPSEADYRNPELKPYIEKYLKGVASVPTEDRMRLLRLIENMTMGTAAVGYLPESMHGAGSPQAQRIMIARQSNLEMKKELAKKIARIQ